MRVRHGITLLAGLFLAGAAVPAGAETLAEPIKEAIAGAERIVRARAVAESSFVLRRATKTAPREVRTDWRLEVLECWNGPLQRGVPMFLRVKGGRIGEVMERVEGEPEIIRGGEYLFFLKSDTAKGRWKTSSPRWGCLPIVRSMVPRPTGAGTTKLTIMRLRREVQTTLGAETSGADGDGADTTRNGQ